MRYWILLLLLVTNLACAYQRGIYITQGTLQNTSRIRQLIRQARAHHINTFVIDFKRLTRQYQRNIALVRKAGLRYVVRIVVFPRGGTVHQVRSPQYWHRINSLVRQAAKLGAQEIQLDYIRYNTKRPNQWQNVRDIHRVIQYFARQTRALKLPLQIAIFGEVAHRPSLRIGQDIRTFAQSVDVVTPMVYPSHYEPFRWHAQHPYRTIYHSLTSLKKQFQGKPPFKIIAYIELYNYRYPFSPSRRIHYIREQLRAVNNANINGWYVWSARNRYQYLFRSLSS